MNTKDEILKKILTFIAISYDNNKIFGVKDVSDFVSKQLKIDGWNVGVTPKYVSVLLNSLNISTEKRGNEQRSFPVINREIRNKIGDFLKEV